jgi:hypothetical protein
MGLSTELQIAPEYTEFTGIISNRHNVIGSAVFKPSRSIAQYALNHRFDGYLNDDRLNIAHAAVAFKVFGDRARDRELDNALPRVRKDVDSELRTNQYGPTTLSLWQRIVARNTISLHWSRHSAEGTTSDQFTSNSLFILTDTVATAEEYVQPIELLAPIPEAIVEISKKDKNDKGDKEKRRSELLIAMINAFASPNSTIFYMERFGRNSLNFSHFRREICSIRLPGQSHFSMFSGNGHYDLAPLNSTQGFESRFGCTLSANAASMVSGHLSGVLDLVTGNIQNKIKSELEAEKDNFIDAGFFRIEKTSY